MMLLGRNLKVEQHALEAGRCKGLGDCLSAGRWLILDGQARIVMMINDVDLKFCNGIFAIKKLYFLSNKIY